MKSALTGRIKSAVANENLRRTLGNAAAQLRSRRRESFSSFEDFNLIRSHVRNAKLSVLSNLDEHLLEFERQLTLNNVHVHWAKTGSDACKIVLAIARQKSVKTIVKSKSMVTEEIFLNRALEDANLRVLETDLGEYIVQLTGGRPSHIVAPIIHMTREQVGEIMHEKLGVPFTDDIGRLTRIARDKLRDEFLSADMGITGANFGVSENGTICIVTNEGNGRMVTAMPKIHVVLMGIEKLVPAPEDLDNMLKLLARSATGQKLTVYTTLIQGPAGRDEDDGPEEMHVILLDNGRTDILSGEQAEILGCIRCGACLNACPVFNCIGGHAYGDIYSGPVGSVVTPGLRGMDGWEELPFASSLCGACRDECPVKLDIPGMLLSLRQSSVEKKAGFKWSFFMKLFSYISTHPGMYCVLRKVGGIFFRLAARNYFLKKPVNYLFKGWTKTRDLKIPARKSFREQWNEREKTNA